ncbi:MAG: phosphoenolpyruvate--protein phosphotransferase [Anaerolineaceae bacterium]|nr:phosphoenolpyruvate--protein phosphotransferase [Anaerolineaceae bacterium]
MEILKGIPVSPGVVQAPAFVLDSEETLVPRRQISEDQIEGEIRRFETALEKSSAELVNLRRKVAATVGEQLGAIFDVHHAMLNSSQLQEEIRETIRTKRVCPEYAASSVLNGYAQQFREMKDEYLSERVQDVHDILRRILRHLIGEKRQQLRTLDVPHALVAHDLTPSQTAALDRSKVLAFATDVGGRTSHTAIMARAMSIPAVVGLQTISSETTGTDELIIDGNRGLVIINPDQETIQRYKTYMQKAKQFESNLTLLRDLPAVTKDGHEITLHGNIEFPQEVAACLERGATGIGLYRTEFLYLDREEDPTEEDHFEAYVSAIEMLDGRPITIRTCDLGADKFTHIAGEGDERNPFLGLRSIRYSLLNVDVFKTQLRAILRASAVGPVRILFPLVTNVRELRHAKMLLGDVREDLEEEGIAFDRNVKVGIMVEVPSAAILPRQFARECDFFSIGTNDLVQYTLAVDRLNERVANIFTPAHPAIIHLIHNVIQAAKAEGVEVGVCGEMGGDPIFTLLLIGMGIDQISTAATSIPEVKKMTRSTSMRQARRVAKKVLTLDNDREITAYLNEVTRKIIPEAFAGEQ